MSLIQTRPEKQTAIIEAAGEMRNALARAGRRNSLNIAEALVAATHALTSVIVGAYARGKDRDVVVYAIPDLIAASTPDWEKIYVDFVRKTQDTPRDADA